MSKYVITVGEVGNEIGHERQIDAADDVAAVARAKRECAGYRRDGWWIVRDDCGRQIANGGRRHL